MQVGRDNWVVDAPNEWTVVQHPECLTLEPANEGALQFSSATKRSGRMDYAELQRIAGLLNDGWGCAQAVAYRDFVGLLFSYVDTEGSFWRRWILGHGSTILFVTWNSRRPISTVDERFIQSTLSTLRIKAKRGEFSLMRRAIAALRGLIGGSGSAGR